MESKNKHYSEREKQELLNIVDSYKTIIENKKTDGVFIQKKKAAWVDICNQFNAISETKRNSAQLLALYKNMKQRAKQQLNNDKMELYKTGGGKFTATVSKNSEQILQMMGDQFEPLQNEYDSSANYYGDPIAEPNNESEITNPVILNNTPSPSPPTTPVPKRRNKKRKATDDDEYEQEKKKLILENLRLDAEIKKVKLKMLYIDLKKKTSRK